LAQPLINLLLCLDVALPEDLVRDVDPSPLVLLFRFSDDFLKRVVAQCIPEIVVRIEKGGLVVVEARHEVLVLFEVLLHTEEHVEEHLNGHNVIEVKLLVHQEYGVTP